MLLLAVLALGACQEDLYTGLEEREANDMVALLLQHGISASKSSGKDGSVTISVDEHMLPAAVDLLRTHGFPHEQYDTVGELFQKQGLVSSPTEDHIRLVYALSQELNETLSRIDGVLSARVHVVMPESGTDGSAALPSSAAVFIRYQDSYDLTQLVPQIKTLVANSIQHLSYDRVSVALFPVREILPQPAGLGLDYARVAYFDVSPSSREALVITLASLVGLVAVLLVASIAMYLYMRQRHLLPPARRPA